MEKKKLFCMLLSIAMVFTTMDFPASASEARNLPEEIAIEQQETTEAAKPEQTSDHSIADETESKSEEQTKTEESAETETLTEPETSSDTSTEPKTEESTETATDTPTELETEESTETSSDTSTELETKASTETTTEESTDSGQQDTGLQVSYRTTDEILSFLDQEHTAITDKITYKEQPVVTAPYQSGALSDDTLNSAAAMVRQIRFIAGLPYDISINTDYSKFSQSAALVNYINNELSAEPSQPGDMPDELFKQGCKGAANSNIAYAGEQTQTLNETILGTWMAAKDNDAIPELEYRRNILNPSMEQIGFGSVKGSNGIFSAMYTADRSGSIENMFGIAWPAQNMPVEYFGSDYPWSVSVDEALSASDIQVTLTRESDGKKWSFSKDFADGDFHVAHDSADQESCIIFRPKISDIAAYGDGDLFQIEITKNKKPYIRYTVQFFSITEKAETSETEKILTAPKASIASEEVVAKESMLVLTSTEDAAVYYTLDGTTPSADSTLYTEPILIDEDITVKAIAVKEGFADSDIAEFSYTVSDEESVRYTVTFESNGGTILPAQSVPENEKIALPENPVKEYDLFEGWYREAECETIWDFENDIVTADITLYANWTEGKTETETETQTADMADTCLITFELQGIGAQIEPVTVNTGETFAAPDTPEAENYTFANWYREAECINTWDFDTDIVTEDIVLYAKWVSEDNADIRTSASRETSDEAIDLSAPSADVRISTIKPRIYNGKAYEPAVTVTAFNGKKRVTLKKGKDYTLKYQNNVKAGQETASVTISGTGAYKGSLEKKFTITPKSIKKLKVTTGSTLVSGGTPTIVIYDGTTRVNNNQFLAAYTDKNDPKKAKLTLTAKENTNYTGSVTVKLTVYDVPKENYINLAKLEITGDTVYTGKAISRNVKVTMGTAELKNNTDYKVQYQNNTNAGTATMIITGKGKYKGKIVSTFNIGKVDISKTAAIDTVPQYVAIAAISPKTYNGKAQKPAVTIKTMRGKKLALNKDYTIAYSNNLHAGTARIAIKGIGNNCEGSTAITFEINPQQIKKASASATKATNQAPSKVVLKYNKKVLQENADYTIEKYEANKKKVKVTITGRADFTGTVTKTLKTDIPQTESATSPAVSNNINRHNYLNFKGYGLEVTSHLLRNGDGTLKRVEYVSGKGVYVENYTADYQFISQEKFIQPELPIYGGFYATEDNYFLVFGQENKSHDDSVEVIRFVKYDKNWNRQASVSLYGANTDRPFMFSSVRMEDHEGVLYVRTGHNMYDGHQANMAFSIDIADMKFINQFYTLGGPSMASHSLNQFITMDEPYLITADHGDAYPRGILLAKHMKAGDKNTYFTSQKSAQTITALKVGGNPPSNITGASLGGLEASDTSYLVVGKSVAIPPASYDPNGILNIYVSRTPKNNFTNEAVEVRWLTDFKYLEYTDAKGEKQKTPQASISNPHLVKISGNEMMLMWTQTTNVIEDNKPVGTTDVKSILLNGDGEPISGIYSFEGGLSDCKPIVDNGNILWYYTSNSAPKFCSININTVRNQPR